MSFDNDTATETSRSQIRARSGLFARTMLTGSGLARASSTGLSGQDRRRSAARLRLVMVAFAACFLSIGIRLAGMATPAQEAEAESPQIAVEQAAPQQPDPRRAELTDRRGQLLATNIVTLSVAADPRRIADAAHAASGLASVLDGVQEAPLAERLSGNGRFAFVKRHISPREQAAVLELGLPGVFFTPSQKRVYPNGRLASHLLGFVDIDNQGLAGIELGQHDRLVGGAGAGKEPLALALDLRAQMVVQGALGEAVREYSAHGGCAFIMDVRSRDIVAMASLPDFDPNHPEDSAADARRNRCIGDVYELGSLFKLVTAAMAFESGKVDLYDRFDASKPLRIGRHTIRDFHGKWRWLSVPEIIAFSSNIGTVQMAEAAGGVERQQEFLSGLGLFDRPDLEVPGSQKPLLPWRWIEIVGATVSYGHGIAVSPLQFAEAVATLVDDGRFERAHFVQREEPVLRDGERVVSEQTTELLRWLMWLTVDKGTSTAAQAQGYLVGGKTGTADKVADDRRGYKRDAVIASFLGAFPIDDPQYIVMVSLDEPQGTKATHGFRFASWNAAPTVGRIIESAGPLLGVHPTESSAAEIMEARLRMMPVINGRTKSEEEGFEAIQPSR